MIASSPAVQKWNKRWFVLHATTHDGVVRLDYYEREDHEATEIGKRTIPLRECMGLSPGVGTKSHSHVFEFKTPIGMTASNLDLSVTVCICRPYTCSCTQARLAM